jgi:hypothetical protein
MAMLFFGAISAGCSGHTVLNAGDPRTALVEFAAAVAQDNLTRACALMNPQAIVLTGPLRTCEDGLRRLRASMSPADLRRIAGQAATARISVNPNDVYATVATTGPVAPRELTRQAGGWLVDFMFPPPATDGAEPHPALTRSWPVSWCRLRVGMTATAARAIMGPPTFRFAGDAVELDWSSGVYGFTAFLDPGSTIARLQADTALACVEVRYRSHESITFYWQLLQLELCTFSYL